MEPYETKDNENKKEEEKNLPPISNLDTELSSINNDGNKLELEEELPDYEDYFTELESKIHDKDFVKFAIDTAQKTVKQEDAMIRQIVYTGLSAYTPDPLNLGIMGPTSEGKTYPVIEVMKFFPDRDVMYIGSMSPKALVRTKGIQVNKNNQSIDDKVKQLRREIAILATSRKQENLLKKIQLREQLDRLLQDSNILIDLSNKIIVFLEPPHPELWQTLKPILSHDRKQISFPFVDKDPDFGIVTKNVVVSGWPACIFCSARDESKWYEWDQIKSRFMITSPNMIEKKYHESNLLIAQRKGLPSLLQEYLIVSSEDIQLAKKCILYIRLEIKKFTECGNNPVWIPYQSILGEILPRKKGTDNRSTIRMFSLLNIIPQAKIHLRPKLVYCNDKLVVATLDDLKETISITHNLSGVPTYKMKFFKEIFNPLYRSKLESGVFDENTDGSKKETIIAVTTRELCNHYKKVTGKTINADNLRKTFLSELLNSGIIEAENSVIDQKKMIYYSVIDTVDDFTNYTTSDKVVKNIHKIAIPMYKNCKDIPVTWLMYEILALGNSRTCLSDITLCDLDGNKQTIGEFVNAYESNGNALSSYFLKPKFEDSDTKIFGELKYLGYISQE